MKRNCLVYWQGFVGSLDCKGHQLLSRIGGNVHVAQLWNIRHHFLHAQATQFHWNCDVAVDALFARSFHHAWAEQFCILKGSGLDSFGFLFISRAVVGSKSSPTILGLLTPKYFDCSGLIGVVVRRCRDKEPLVNVHVFVVQAVARRVAAALRFVGLVKNGKVDGGGRFQTLLLLDDAKRLADSGQ